MLAPTPAVADGESFKFRCERRRPSEIEGLVLCGELRCPPLTVGRWDRSVDPEGVGFMVGVAVAGCTGGATLDDREDELLLL